MANLPLTLNNQPKPLVCNCGSTTYDVIATHILFTQIRRELEKRGIARQQAFQEYDSLGLKCSDISKSRPRHYRAAMVLAKALMVSLKDEPKE